MGDAIWKQVERAVARRLGGQRLGCTGLATPDVQSDWLTVEVKTRKRLPRWLVEALAQACIAAEDGHLPLVVLHEVGQRHDDDLVLLRLADFVDWFGELPGG